MIMAELDTKTIEEVNKRLSDYRVRKNLECAIGIFLERFGDVHTLEELDNWMNLVEEGYGS